MSIFKLSIQKMTKIASLTIILLLSCAAPKKANTDLFFTTIYKSDYGNNENASILHITNNDAYVKFIESLKLDESEFNKFLPVNFKENNIIVLNQGRKSSGGYSIDVETIRWENNTLLIFKKETTPKKGEQVTMALTSPYCITVIPKAKFVKLM